MSTPLLLVAFPRAVEWLPSEHTPAVEELAASVIAAPKCVAGTRLAVPVPLALPRGDRWYCCSLLPWEFVMQVQVLTRSCSVDRFSADRSSVRECELGLVAEAGLEQIGKLCSSVPPSFWPFPPSPRLSRVEPSPPSSYCASPSRVFADISYSFCEGEGDVVGVVAPLGGVAQVIFHGVQVVEVGVQVRVHEEGEKEKDGEVQVEVERERSKRIKDDDTCMTWREDDRLKDDLSQCGVTRDEDTH